MNTSRKRTLSLCILGGRLHSRAKVQVTGKDRSHTKAIGHWTKLFLIDILLYKNKTSQGTSIIFFLFWTLPNPTHEKIYSCWSRKEDLRYSVTKVGNEITKVCKITWFVKKKKNLKTKGYCIKNIVTCLWMFWKVDGKNLDSVKLIWPLKYGNFLQTFLVLNSSCHSMCLPSLLKVAACCSGFIPVTKCCFVKA